MRHPIARTILAVVTAFFVFLPATTAFADDTKAEAQQVEKKPLADRAAAVLELQLVQDAEKRIPRKLRDEAKCVAVFPSVVEGGFIVAVKRGHGLVSCRDEAGHWGAPVAVNLAAGSVGLQAGIQKASIIMMFMTDKAVENLLAGGKMSGGAGIDIAAGPVGSDVNLDSQPSVVSYSRSKGLFAGVSLEGAKVGFAKKVNAEYYGDATSARDVLHGAVESADALKPFQEVLGRFSDRA